MRNSCKKRPEKEKVVMGKMVVGKEEVVAEGVEDMVMEHGAVMEHEAEEVVERELGVEDMVMEHEAVMEHGAEKVVDREVVAKGVEDVVIEEEIPDPVLAHPKEKKEIATCDKEERDTSLDWFEKAILSDTEVEWIPKLPEVELPLYDFTQLKEQEPLGKEGLLKAIQEMFPKSKKVPRTLTDLPLADELQEMKAEAYKEFMSRQRREYADYRLQPSPPRRRKSSKSSKGGSKSGSKAGSLHSSPIKTKVT